MLKYLVVSALSFLACTPSNLRDLGEGVFFDEPSSVLCTNVDNYCLPINGKVGYVDNSCTSPTVGYVDTIQDPGKTRDGSISKYVSRGSTGYFDFYELGYSSRYLTNSEVSGDEVFYELGEFNTNASPFYWLTPDRKCEQSTDDPLSYKVIVSADTDRNMFTKF